MRILLIHNKYKLPGGEDSVFETETNLLENHAHTVKTFLFNNGDINTVFRKIKLSYQLIYNNESEQVMNKLITEFKPDVIHVHNFFYLASPSVFYAANKNKVPVVVTLHNYRLICSGSLLMRDLKPCELCVNQVFPVHGVRYGCHRGSKLETAQLTIATGIHKFINTWNNKVSLYISLTEFAREKFINSSLKLVPEKIVVKPNSVDNVQPSTHDERENYFLYVGRLSEEKGIQVILEAFDKKDAVIEIIGDGPLRQKVEEMAKKNVNIKYFGYRDKSFIISRLKKCRALIVPSICYESLPTAVLEAFSSGTPVLISDNENLNAIVSNRYNGLHFKTNNAQDLYNCVEDFNTNLTRYKHLYVNARNTYLEKYTPEINYNNLIKIYETAIYKHGTDIKLKVN